MAQFKSYLQSLWSGQFFNRLTSNKTLAWLIGWVVFLALIQIVTIGLSLIKFRIGPLVATNIFCLGTLGGVAAGVWASRSIPLDEMQPPRKSIAGTWLAIIVSLFALYVYFGLWVFSYGLMDYTWDGQIYHIPTMHIWATEGYVHWVDRGYNVANYMNGYPKAMELMNYIVCQATLNDHLNNTGSLWFIPIGAIALVHLAMLFGAPGWAAIISGACWLFVPNIIAQSITAYVDSSYAACVIAATALLITWVKKWGTGRHVSMIALVLGAAIGLCIGVKGSGVIMCVAAVPLLCLTAIARSLPGSRFIALRILSTSLLALILAATFTGGYWLIRNYYFGRSPLFPVGVHMAGRTIFPGMTVAKAIGESSNTPVIFRQMPDWQKVAAAWLQIGGKGPTAKDERRWPDIIRGNESREGGIGYMWVSGYLLAFLGFLSCCAWRPPWRSQALLWFSLTVIWAILFFLQPMHWWARYISWVYMLGAPAFALALGWAWQRHSIMRWLVRIWSLGVLGIGLFEGWYVISGIDQLHRSRPPLRYEQDILFREMENTVFDLVWGSSSNVGVGPILGFSHYKMGCEMLMGALSVPFGKRHIVPLPAKGFDDKFKSQLLEKNVRWVIWTTYYPIPPELKKLTKREHTVKPWILLDLEKTSDSLDAPSAY